ncbi:MULTISPECIES: type II toxin-antitoxin system VapC family toxin [unclassified Sphingomonas]|uniref:type II toxin-antitoxin system VapC family toxin n=1 Tax=unclassified Sphingomonas TaxID=196159 RepID=UPI000835EA68|nr:MULTISPECIES: type II toxin-antitoxin system VapC family toxin [unclassified Sphingomonas]
MTLLVDASVAAKWITAEVDSDRAMQWLATPFAAPEFMILELTSILWKKSRQGQITPLQALAGLEQVEETVDLVRTFGLERRALEIGMELEHSPYDCLYLALAETMDAKILTADAALVRNCMNSRFKDQLVLLK